MNNPGRMVGFNTGKVMDGEVIGLEYLLEELKDGGFTFPKNQFTRQSVVDWIQQAEVREFK